MSEPDPPRPDARTRILDAAERLSAEAGNAATSIRRITGEAKVPVALVSHHFGSKRGLMEAVHQRALSSGGMSRERYLDRLARAADGRPVAVAMRVEAFVSSAPRLRGADSIPGADFKHLIGRAFYDPGPGAEPFFPAEYADAVERCKRFRAPGGMGRNRAKAQPRGGWRADRLCFCGWQRACAKV